MKTSILIALIEKTSLIVVLFLLITKLKIFKQIFQKEEYSFNDLVCIALVFTFLAIFGTYSGINYMGSIVNTRIISIVSGGILFGPMVGITAGVFSGIHRYFMDIGGITSVPCLLSSILAGVLSGFLYKRIPKQHRVMYGILVGMISESFTILLIYLISYPHSLAIQIIGGIYLPLIVGQIGIGFVISIVEGIEKDKKDIEARNERKKSEIKALQRQINPHFLFNSLNTIASFIRFSPDKARELIINLSTYLRYNLEYSDNLIDINKEIEQVKSFVEIEKARFGELLTVSYDIEDVNIKIPSLIIQPLVENAIIHGILESGRAGVVKISIKKLPYSLENTVRISIEDNGIGISEEIINNVYQDNMPENKIGLYNVHLRLKLMYGRGLNIRRIDNGTLIVFYVKE